MLPFRPGYRAQPRAALDSPYVPEARAFFARLATQPTATVKGYYDATIRTLLAGGVWTKLDALYIFAAVDEATALTNLVQTAYGATATGSPSFASNVGYSGASAKYIDSGYNPATAGGKFVQDSATFFAWALNDAQDNGRIGGSAGAGNTEMVVRTGTPSDQYFLRVNSASFANGAAANGSGLWAISRADASNQIPYRNGSSLGSEADASAAPVSANLAFLRGSDASAYVLACAAGGFGENLSGADHAVLYNALRAYLQPIAGVP